MIQHCTIKKVDGITIIHFSRAPTFSDAKLVIDKLADENVYHLRLWDFSDVLFNFTMEEIKQIARYGQLKFKQPNRMALVAPQDVAYGTLRAFDVYRQQGTHSISETFRTKQEAIDWLKEQRGLLKPSMD